MSIRQEIINSIKRTRFEKVEKTRSLKSIYGINTFNVQTMKEFVKSRTYTAFRQWIDEGKQISSVQADEIAEGMKKWAIAKGAVYYTHWFQPMTGLTAEKHDGFTFEKYVRNK